MTERIKEYLDYRKNRKAVRRTLMKLTAAALLEMLTYMAELTSEDIRKILIHSAVETMPDSTGSNS